MYNPTHALMRALLGGHARGMLVGACNLMLIGACNPMFTTGGGPPSRPPNLTSIGEWAFAGCTSLTEFTLPAGCLSIGEGAFSGCP